MDYEADSVGVKTPTEIASFIYLPGFAHLNQPDTGCFSKNKKIIGMTTNVKIVEDNKPPMITHAMLTRVSEPSVIAKAVGIMPTTIVSVVMNIGFNLTLPASIIARQALKTCFSR